MRHTSHLGRWPSSRCPEEAVLPSARSRAEFERTPRAPGLGSAAAALGPPRRGRDGRAPQAAPRSSVPRAGAPPPRARARRGGRKAAPERPARSRARPTAAAGQRIGSEPAGSAEEGGWPAARPRSRPRRSPTCRCRCPVSRSRCAAAPRQLRTSPPLPALPSRRRKAPPAVAEPPPIGRGCAGSCASAEARRAGAAGGQAGRERAVRSGPSRPAGTAAAPLRAASHDGLPRGLSPAVTGTRGRGTAGVANAPSRLARFGPLRNRKGEISGWSGPLISVMLWPKVLIQRVEVPAVCGSVALMSLCSRWTLK